MTAFLGIYENFFSPLGGKLFSLPLEKSAIALASSSQLIGCPCGLGRGKGRDSAVPAALHPHAACTAKKRSPAGRFPATLLHLAQQATLVALD